MGGARVRAAAAEGRLHLRAHIRRKRWKRATA